MDFLIGLDYREWNKRMPADQARTAFEQALKQEMDFRQYSTGMYLCIHHIYIYCILSKRLSCSHCQKVQSKKHHENADQAMSSLDTYKHTPSLALGPKHQSRATRLLRLVSNVWKSHTTHPTRCQYRVWHCWSGHPSDPSQHLQWLCWLVALLDSVIPWWTDNESQDWLRHVSLDPSSVRCTSEISTGPTPLHHVHHWPDLAQPSCAAASSLRW